MSKNEHVMEEEPPGSPAEKKEQNGRRGGRRKGAGKPSGPTNRSKMQIEHTEAIREENIQSRREESSLLLDHSLLGGEKGKTMGEGEARMALALIIGLRISSAPSDTAAIEYASFLLGKGDKTLWSLWNHWKEKREILVISTENRGAGSLLHPLHHIQLESDHIATIHRTIYELNENGDGCKTTDIIAALKEEHGLYLLPRSLRSVLSRLGYQYGKAKYIGCINKEERKRRMIIFVKQFAKALSKCVLILDNARYHRARGAEYVNPSTMTKLELIHHLELFGINSITVSRRGQSVQFNSASFYRRGGGSGPTNAELKAALQDYLNKNPHLQRSRSQTLFDAEDWQLLFTPPYNSECQPIEKVWAAVKKFVAKQYTSDRSLEETRLQTLDGFYGAEERNHAGITSDFCQRCIQHVKEYCDWFCRETITGVERMEDLVEENFPSTANAEEEDENDEQLQVSDNENDNSDEE